ncbi:MAG: glycosyltransferase [Planctomycetes bacterium]|nr:glycosyltransferase [Planctomycetota bacterium]
MKPPLVHTATSHRRLPRLLYIGDHPVESTVASATWFHRLLSSYPADRLRIVEGNLAVSRPDRRLADVEYSVLRIGIPRLMRSRFRGHQSDVVFRAARWAAWRLTGIIRRFRPEAVLGVAHGSLWRTAAAVAATHDLPLHLVIHDDIQRMSAVTPGLHAAVDKAFAEVYRQAASRLCISEYMERWFHDRLGVHGSVLPPMRAPGIPPYSAPAAPSGRASLVFAYTGSIHRDGYQGNLAPLARALAQAGHRLHLIGGVTNTDLPTLGLGLPNVTALGFLPAEGFHDRLRRDIDVMVIPMSFRPELSRDMLLAFPSKLADGTGIGIPLLVWGPPYCSAVQWARQHVDSGEIVTADEASALTAAIARLECPNHRLRLASGAMAAGVREFALETVVDRFHDILLGQGVTSRV